MRKAWGSWGGRTKSALWCSVASGMYLSRGYVWSAYEHRELYKWAATILTSRCFSSAAFGMTHGDQQPTISSGNEDEEAIRFAPAPTRFPILLPVFDIANHDPCASVTWGSENSSCSFTVNQDIPAGKEICISYDNKSNEEREYAPAPLRSRAPFP
jgi:hypothetical protein